MTPQPVAAAHKDLPPHPVAAASPPASPVDFSQILDDVGAPTRTVSTGSTTTSTSATPPVPPKAKNNDGSDANAAAALAALAAQAQPQQPPPPVQNAATPAQGNAALTASLPPVLPAGATKDANGNGNNDQTTPPPPGASDVEARIVRGAPTYVSQPSSMLAGLWHHTGDTPQSAAADQGNAGTPSATGSDAQSQTVQGAKTAALGSALAQAQAQAQHAADAGESVAAVQADPSQTTSTASTTDATPAAQTSFATQIPTDAPAAANTATPVVVTPMHVLPVYEQVAINLKQAAQTGTDHIEIQLKPASLGAISVKLDVTHDGHLTAVISADRSDTLHMLRQDSAGLQQALRDAGLHADAGSLSFNLRGEGQSFAQAQQQPGPTTWSHSTQSDTTAISDTPAARMRSHSGALDIEV